MAPSWIQILIVAVAVVLLLGRGKIASLMGEVAQGIRSFRKGMQEDSDPLSLDADVSANQHHDDDVSEKESAKGDKQD